MKRRGFMILLVCAALGAAVLYWRCTPVEGLRIGEHSVHMQVGESLPLTVGGQLRDGGAAYPEQLERLRLQWRTNQEEILAVDGNGTLTGLSAGVGNVQVYSERFDLYSPPITVYVE